AGHVAGIDTEPFALAATRPLRPMTAPRPSVSISAADASLEPGQETVVTATFSNPADEMSGCSPSMDLALTGPGEIASTAVDSLPSRIAPGATITRSWTIRATGSGTVTATARAQDSAYGSTLEGERSTSILARQAASDPPPSDPPPTSAKPAPTQPPPVLTPPVALPRAAPE